MTDCVGFISLLAADPPQATGWESLLGGPLPLIVMLGVLAYLMVIRPEKQRRAVQAAMLANLKKNDRVITAGGIYGTVVNVNREADEVTVKVDESNNTRLRVRISSITALPSDKDEKAQAAADKSGS